MRATIVVALAVVAVAVAAEIKQTVEDNTAGLENKINQMVWKRCALQLTPICIKLSLARLVDRLADDTDFQPLPGVLLVANRSRSLQTSSESLSSMQRIDGYLVEKVVNYFRSLTMSIKFLDLPSFNSTDIFDGMFPSVTGRKKNNNNGMMAMALMLGGAMMTMMMSALAAMAGKALMTSMMALMLAAMGAMKGGGGGKSTTYEIIAKPEISHAHSHSSEVQHGHWKRSVNDAHWPFFGLTS